MSFCVHFTKFKFQNFASESQSLVVNYTFLLIIHLQDNRPRISEKLFRVTSTVKTINLYYRLF